MPVSRAPKGLGITGLAVNEPPMLNGSPVDKWEDVRDGAAKPIGWGAEGKGGGTMLPGLGTVGCIAVAAAMGFMNVPEDPKGVTLGDQLLVAIVCSGLTCRANGLKSGSSGDSATGWNAGPRPSMPTAPNAKGWL